MPQVSVQQPGQGLIELFSSPSMMLGDIAQKAIQQTQGANDLNMSQARQAQDFERQRQPYELEKLFLSNQTDRARLPGIDAESSLAQDKAGISRATIDDQTRAARSALMNKVSDAEVTEAQNQIKQLTMHPDPRVRAYGEKLMLGFSDFQKDINQERERRKTSQAGISANIQGQKELEEMRINAGKYDKKKGAGSAKGIEDAVLTGKMGYEKAATAFAYLANQALDAGETDQYNNFITQANKYNELYVQARKASVEAGQAGKPDVSAMTNGSIPVTPKAPVADFSRPGWERPAPAGSAPAGLAEALRASGVPYEPSKYDYRVDPTTGKLQRKAKGQ